MAQTLSERPADELENQIVVTGSLTFTALSAGYLTEVLVPIFRAPWPCLVVSAHLTSARASTGSVAGTIYWESHIRNTTAGVDLCGTKWNSGASELAAGVPKDLGVNQNRTLATGEQIAAGVRALSTALSMQNAPWTWTLVIRRI